MSSKSNKRTPVIHVTVDALAIGLKSVLEDYGLQVNDSNKLAMEILVKCQPYGIVRKVTLDSKSKKHYKKQVDRQLQVSDNDVGMFQMTYKSAVASKGMNYPMAKILPQSSNYGKIQSIVLNIKEFAKDYGLAFNANTVRTYVDIGLSLMTRKKSIFRFGSLTAKIYEQYNAILEVSSSENMELAHTVLNAYAEGVLEYASVTYDTKVALSDPTIMLDFIYVADQLVDLDLHEDIVVWVSAQFERMAFLGSVPETYQLHGSNAEKRYRQFVLALQGNNADTGFTDPNEDITSIYND